MSEFVVVHDSPLAVWGQLSRDIRQQVERGVLVPGGRLPTERELATAYGVNRLTVRQALDHLEQDGIIARKRGFGTYVSEHVVTVQHDLSLTRPWRERAEEAGLHAESVLIRRSQKAPVPSDLIRELALDDTELAVGEPYVEYERVQKIDGTPIGISRSWVPDRIALQLPRVLIGGSLSQTLREHLNLSSATTFNVMESTVAFAAEAVLLETYPDAPLFVVNAISRLGDGSVLNLSRTAWLGSRVRFRSRRVS